MNVSNPLCKSVGFQFLLAPPQIPFCYRTLRKQKTFVGNYTCLLTEIEEFIPELKEEGDC